MSTWILVANAAEGKLYTTENLRLGDLGDLKVRREFSHVNSRKKIAELMSDKPGHYKTDSGMRGSYSKNDPKEVEADHFAVEIAEELKTGLKHKQCKYLIIVALPHFYGLIRKHLGTYLADMEHIAKDYTKYPLVKLVAAIKEHLFI